VAYAVEREESLAQNLRRIADEQIERAAAALRDAQATPDERVHAARKRFKESRALFRLFRAALGDAFDLENAWYRDAGRELAPYRDATAVMEAIEALPRKLRGALGRAAMRRLRLLSRRRRDVAFAEEDTLAAVVEGLVTRLPQAALRVYGEHLQEAGGFAMLEPGISRTLRDGRKAMLAAFSRGGESDFHEWRKRVKDHWYHVQLLLPVSDELKRREKILGRLSRRLGDHHDLTVLVDVVEATPDAFGGADEVARIVSLLRQRQQRLAEESLRIGASIYAAPPSSLAPQLEPLWNRWRGD
jgi:CHAD domain-containing protein